MKIKWGALVVDGRNKIGGHVASRNRAGAYLRTKVTPVHPGTTYQVNAKNRVIQISALWLGLSQARITAWNAAAPGFAKTDIFGDLRNPSGINLHQRLNNNLYGINETNIADPPLSNLPPGFSALSIAAAAGAKTLTLTFAPAIPTGVKVKLFATPPISPGTSFVKSEFRQYDVLDMNDSSAFDSETEYILRFGDPVPAGKKIFVRMVQVRTATGQAGIGIQASCIISA